MSGKLGDYLNSINQSKKNIIRGQEPLDIAEKMYPSFPVSRCLSYHPDAILYINELNCFGLAEHKLRPMMHYEFLLHSLPRRNRFAKMQKAPKDNNLELVKKYYKYSTDKALEIMDLLSDETLAEIQEHFDQGG
jgi:hypothetical protein